MHHGQRLHDWGQTGNLLAMLANVNRDPKKKRSPYPTKAFVPADLKSEFPSSQGIRMSRTTLHALKPIFKE